MRLRCLLFCSKPEMVQPIWRALADLGIEGEHCQRAVDAVEKVTTQLFQIVITDWEDQPEAAFLLKTARELKAAQRPLTLAIVGDEARPEALKAGANSVLLKPLRLEQVRDTMSTACELLRAKHPADPMATISPPESPRTATMAAVASASAASVPISVTSSLPQSVTQSPEKTFRAGEFLQSAGSAPGAQFETEDSKPDVDKSGEQDAAEEVEALTELEPTAGTVEDAQAPEPEPEHEIPLTGWAALQARLTKTTSATADDASAKSELLSYGETPSSSGAAGKFSADEDKDSVNQEEQPGSEAALFAYMRGEASENSERTAAPRFKIGRIFLGGMLVACLALAAIPRARHGFQKVFGAAVRAGGSWLNPPPAPVPQAAPQHDSFGQAGDEYKLPVVGTIPDATTDPSQIHVLPVVDPTAKPDKNAEANGAQATAASGESINPDQSQTTPSQNESNPVESSQTTGIQSGQALAGQSSVKDATTTSMAGTPGNVEGAAHGPIPRAVQGSPKAAEVQGVVSQPRPVAPAVQKSSPPHVSASSSAGIPSSLKSQIASATPEASGNKPLEAAMSSIEPVNLPEPEARDLLIQSVDPPYPAAARASGQRGSVVLQVLIGRDGVVRDAKFISGSLVFARAAIDAVKQWRFKPYLMNGRAVSVQSVINLNFRPPA